MARRLHATARLIVVVALSGCAYYTPRFSALNYDPSAMEIVGPASCTVSHQYILGFGPGSGAKSFGIDAYDCAAKSVKADELLNVVTDESLKMDFFLLVFRRTVTVRGLGVRLKK